MDSSRAYDADYCTYYFLNYILKRTSVHVSRRTRVGLIFTWCPPGPAVGSTQTTRHDSYYASEVTFLLWGH